MLPITPRRQARLPSVETNPSDTHPSARSWNNHAWNTPTPICGTATSSICKDLRWVGRGVSEKDNRADGRREKKCPLPSTGFEPCSLMSLMFLLEQWFKRDIITTSTSLLCFSTSSVKRQSKLMPLTGNMQFSRMIETPPPPLPLTLFEHFLQLYIELRHGSRAHPCDSPCPHLNEQSKDQVLLRYKCERSKIGKFMSTEFSFVTSSWQISSSKKSIVWNAVKK